MREEKVSTRSTADDDTDESSSTDESESTTSAEEPLSEQLTDDELPSEPATISTEPISTNTEDTASENSGEQSESSDTLDTGAESNAETTSELAPRADGNFITAPNSNFQPLTEAGTDYTDLVAEVMAEQGGDSVCSSIPGYNSRVTETVVLSTTVTVSTPSVIFQVATSTTEAVTTETATADTTEDAETTGTATTDATDDAEISGTATTDATEDAETTGTATADATGDADTDDTASADTTEDAEITGTATADATGDSDIDDTALESRSDDNWNASSLESLITQLKTISNSPSSRKQFSHNKRQLPDQPGLSYLSPSLVSAACLKLANQPTVTVSTTTITAYEQVATTVVASTQLQTSFSTIIVARSGEGYKSVSE